MHGEEDDRGCLIVFWLAASFLLWANILFLFLSFIGDGEYTSFSFSLLSLEKAMLKKKIFLARVVLAEI